jgi:catechol 2,3-dioxygenase-like lactoylglutathione lyase family enzyme
MQHCIVNIALVVRDYDEAIRYYTGVLGFELVEDEPREPGKRWVRVKPKGDGPALLLAKAATPAQVAAIGNQTGGRVFLFLHTDDFNRDYQRLQSHGVTFLGEPRQESYGQVVVFLDLYGNKWDLIEPDYSSPFQGEVRRG